MDARHCPSITGRVLNDQVVERAGDPTAASMSLDADPHLALLSVDINRRIACRTPPGPPHYAGVRQWMPI